MTRRDDIADAFKDGFTAQQWGNDTYALECFLQAKALGEEHNDSSAVASAALEAQAIHAKRLEFEPALALARSARGAANSVSDNLHAALAINAEGELLCHLGEQKQAVALHHQAAEALTSLGEPTAAAWALSNAAWALQELGRYEEAAADYDSAITLAAGAEQPAAVEEHRLGRATALADVGEIDEAILIVAPLESTLDEWHPLRCKAHVLARAGLTDEARSLFAAALSFLEADENKLEYRCCLRQMDRLGLLDQP